MNIVVSNKIKWIGASVAAALLVLALCSAIVFFGIQQKKHEADRLVAEGFVTNTTVMDKFREAQTNKNGNVSYEYYIKYNVPAANMPYISNWREITKYQFRRLEPGASLKVYYVLGDTPNTVTFRSEPEITFLKRQARAGAALTCTLLTLSLLMFGLYIFGVVCDNFDWRIIDKKTESKL